MKILKSIFKFALFKFAVRGFAVIGFAVVLISAAGWIAVLTRDPPKLPQDIILTLDLRHKIAEQLGDNPFDIAFNKGDLDARDTIAALDLAAKDPRVKILIGRFQEDAAGFAQAQEIRASLFRFRAAGKLTFASATSFGELGPADRAYYIASAFNEIWMQPVSVLGFTGLAAQAPFVKNALEKAGVMADFTTREDYKTAVDMFTHNDFTDANAEMTASLLDDISNQVVADIAEDRSLNPIDIFGIIDSALLTSAEALDAGLIDRIGYADEIEDWAFNRLGDKADFVPVQDYLALRRGEIAKTFEKKEDVKTPVVAYLHAVGEIAQDGTGFRSGDGIAADEFAASLQDIINEGLAEAVLIRLDSPGGSAVASETIRYAMARVRQAGLPIIISMGAMAGSGAYWMASEADAIVANPATLTGSIGVVAGKFVGTEIWDKLGVRWGAITRGENADIWSVTAPFSPMQRARLDALVDDAYLAFKQRVAAGRDMPMEDVAALAKGRVWTGSQAFDLGLVDELGGFQDAVALTKSMLGVAEDDMIFIKNYPEEENLLDKIKKSLGHLGQFGLMMKSLTAHFNLVMPALNNIMQTTLPAPRQARMPNSLIQ